MNEPIHILYLETDLTDVQRVKDILANHTINYQFFVVSSQDGFNKALIDVSIHIILAAYPISFFSCQEVLNVRKNGNRIPLVLITSEVFEESAVELVTKGVDDYILKDRLSRLPIAIQKALKNHRHEQERQAFIEGLVVSEKKAANLLSDQNITALREKAFQANLLDTIGQAAIATNLNGQVIFWNKAAEQIYGWTAHEAMHANIMNLIPSIQSRDDAKEIMACLKTGRAWTGEFKAQHKNGKRFPTAITNSPIYDQDQNLTGIIGISSDITEKKALEERLDSTSILARIGIYDADLANNRIFWSNMTRQIHDVGSDYIPTIDHALHFFKEGFSRNAVTEAYRQAKENGTAFDLEVQMVTAAGNQRWIRVIGQSECIQGACIRIYGSLQDITKIKTAELEVRKLYEEKNIILESIGDAFFAIDQNWTISYWNKTAEKVLGKTKAQTVGQHLWNVFSDAIGSESNRMYQQAIDTQEAVHFEDFYLPLEKWYEVSAYPSANLLSVYFKDITERKQTLSALEESERNYSRLFNLSPLPMWVFDSETLQFLDVNEAAISSYGYSLNEFLTMTIEDIFFRENPGSIQTVMKNEKAKGAGLFVHEIFTHRKKDGKLMWVEIRSNMIRYHGKGAKIVIATDMTERYSYIHAIEEQNAKLREIAWIQSHVVRAPLARIMGLIPMITDTDDYFGDRKTLFDYLLIAANELDDAIKNISSKTENTSDGTSIL